MTIAFVVVSMIFGISTMQPLAAQIPGITSPQPQPQQQQQAEIILPNNSTMTKTGKIISLYGTKTSVNSKYKKLFRF